MNPQSRSLIAAPLVIGGAALLIASFFIHAIPNTLVVAGLYGVASGLIVLNDRSSRTVGILFAITITAALTISLSGRGATPGSKGGDLYSYGEPDSEGGTSFYPSTPYEEPSGTSTGGYYSEPNTGI